MRPFLTLHKPAVFGAYFADGLWRQDTLYDLLRHHAADRPDAWALRDGRRQLTWLELREWVDGIAHDLRTCGLVGGDRVSIWASNRVETIALFLACSREGFACNPSLHRAHTCNDVANLIKRLSSRCLLTEPGWGSDRDVVHLDAVLADIPSLKVVYSPDTFPRAAPYMAPPCADPDKVLYLAFTSGTTGAPKCVMHSDNTLLANARDLVRDWSHGPDAALLSLSPLSHHIAWVAVAQWLLAGCLFATDDPPVGKTRLDWIIEVGATYVMGVPTHAMDILAEQSVRSMSRIGSVKIFYIAGAPIPPSVADALLQQGVTPQNVYGMTENSSHQYTHPTDDPRTIVETCGRGGRAYEVKLFDPVDQDRQVGSGEIGHIGGKGAALMLGYFDDQAATERSFNRDGWFMSGDLGVLDDAGNLRIVGRLKDLIIRGGHNIYPAHIEAVAIRHPDVKKAACFPVEDERLGERVCIAVIGAVQPDDLLAHLADNGLSKFDLPEYFVTMKEFPMTASGKILKRSLAEMAKHGQITPTFVRYQVGGQRTA